MRLRVAMAVEWAGSDPYPPVLVLGVPVPPGAPLPCAGWIVTVEGDDDCWTWPVLRSMGGNPARIVVSHLCPAAVGDWIEVAPP